jgi:hypothetical protein
MDCKVWCFDILCCGVETIKINTINFLKNEYFDYKLHESPLLYGDAMFSPIDSGGYGV